VVLDKVRETWFPVRFVTGKETTVLLHAVFVVAVDVFPQQRQRREGM
jgi:hypothetical protein